MLPRQPHNRTTTIQPHPNPLALRLTVRHGQQLTAAQLVDVYEVKLLACFEGFGEFVRLLFRVGECWGDGDGRG